MALNNKFVLFTFTGYMGDEPVTFRSTSKRSKKLRCKILLPNRIIDFGNKMLYPIFVLF